MFPPTDAVSDVSEFSANCWPTQTSGMRYAVQVNPGPQGTVVMPLLLLMPNLPPGVAPVPPSRGKPWHIVMSPWPPPGPIRCSACPPKAPPLPPLKRDVPAPKMSSRSQIEGVPRARSPSPAYWPALS